MKSRIDSKRRVVITGLGVVSSLGIGWQEFWKNLIAGKSGISQITSFDTLSHDRHFAGEIKNFDPEQFINKKRIKLLGRSSQMAIAASSLAMNDAGLDKKNFSKKRIGVCIGTTMGEPQVMEKSDEKNVSDKKSLEYDALSSLAYPANSISNNVAIELGLNGENFIFSSACAAGNYAVSRSFDLIRNGRSDLMFAGGADALSRIAFTGFGRLFAMAPEICQPFDKNRKGMMLGEGSGILVLESLESAKKRKANIYAEIKGAGFSCDATHMTNPSVDGIKKAMASALNNSDVDYKKIEYICAHGTGTKENDKTECQAIVSVFDGMANKIPISSIKSMLGHTMGAAAALETVACCLVIKNGEIPPTINMQNFDPECHGVNCIFNKSVKISARYVLNNSQAFGGNNSCLVLKYI